MTTDEFTIHRAAALLAKKWGSEGASGRKRQREQEQASKAAASITAQIIPFPVPAAPARTPRDRRDAEFVRLIREACAMELAGVDRPDWDAHVAECLTKARSE